MRGERGGRRKSQISSVSSVVHLNRGPEDGSLSSMSKGKKKGIVTIGKKVDFVLFPLIDSLNETSSVELPLGP